jgi:hypothetical protein
MLRSVVVEHSNDKSHQDSIHAVPSIKEFAMRYQSPGTIPAYDNVVEPQALGELRLDMAATGKVVTVTTESGSNYYFTRLSGATTTTTRVVGVTVASNSKTFGYVPRNPRENQVTRLLRVGFPVSINGGTTGNIRSIKIEK